MNAAQNEKKDIILINPYSLLLNGQHANVGLASIEAYLKSNGINCFVVNIPITRLSEIDAYIDKSDIFGLSVMDHSYDAAQKLSQKLQHKTVIWGGWTATALAEFILNAIPGVDYVISREGEKRLLNLLKSFHQPKLFEKIDGIAYRNGDNKITTRPPTEFLDLDELPIPTELAIVNKFVCVELARGCHGSCRYCQEIHTMRFKSAVRAADEIQYWYESEKRHKCFYLGDANSIASGKLLSELAREIKKRDLHISGILAGRPDDVLRHARILEELFTNKHFHLHTLEIGIEANTKHLLDLLGRRLSPETNREAITRLLELKKKYSPETRISANIILFSHFDMTIDDFVENVRFIGDFDCSWEGMTLQLYGLANTPIWHDMTARGFHQHRDRGLQIYHYPFTDKDIARLFKKLISEPLKKAPMLFSENRINFQHQCHAKLMEFYHSQNIKESVLNFINSRDSEN